MPALDLGVPALVTSAYEGLGDFYSGLELGAEVHLPELDRFC